MRHAVRKKDSYHTEKSIRNPDLEPKNPFGSDPKTNSMDTDKRSWVSVWLREDIAVHLVIIWLLKVPLYRSAQIVEYLEILPLNFKKKTFSASTENFLSNDGIVKPSNAKTRWDKGRQRWYRKSAVFYNVLRQSYRGGTNMHFFCCRYWSLTFFTIFWVLITKIVVVLAGNQYLGCFLWPPSKQPRYWVSVKTATIFGVSTQKILKKARDHCFLSVVPPYFTYHRRTPSSSCSGAVQKMW